MDVFRLVSIGIIGAIACLLLKKTDGQYAALAAVDRLGIGLLVLLLRAAADHAVPHLLKDRQRRKDRKYDQQRALHRRHISGPD